MSADTWIAIADGARARFFSYQGVNAPLKPEGVLDHINEPTRELVTNKRGRVFHSADGTRAAMAHPSDPHEQEKRNFAREVAESLNARAGEIERLILIAPPKMLGELRQLLSARIQEKVSDELDKDLTNIPDDAIAAHLQYVLHINARPQNLPESTPYAKP